jgi:hypothetical protein
MVKRRATPTLKGMKPGDHPEFFRFPAPEGRSRESTIRLDENGHFFHEGHRVEHPKLEAAMHTWIARHPDDHRYILTNGYDWTYFTVEDAAFFVVALRIADDSVSLVLSDGTTEAWHPTRSWTGRRGAVYTEVKQGVVGGPFTARFTPHAQTSLAPLLEEDAGAVWVQLGGERTLLSQRD